MTTIKGTPVAVEAVAAIRDKDAGCPQPYSLLIAGVWRNVCPRCHEPITPPWTCPKCGWTHADGAVGARYQMGLRVADVTVDDKGVASTPVSEDMATAITEAKAKPAASQSKDEKTLASCVVVEEKPPPEEEKPIDPIIDPKEITR